MTKKNLNITHRFLNLIKNQDSYGDPVQISYKGMNSHTSLLGGILSILEILFLLGYGNWRYNLHVTH